MVPRPARQVLKRDSTRRPRVPYTTGPAAAWPLVVAALLAIQAAPLASSAGAGPGAGVGSGSAPRASLPPAGDLSGGESAILTQHQARIAGRPLRYTAEIGRLAIREAETGAALGYMGYVAYRVASSPVAPRPVVFVWNGGPGANSALLHFSTAGPKRAGGGALIDNADSWLDAADVVMVDPIGTGFSRPAKPEYAAQFYGTRGDVASVAEFVRAWLLRHDADEAPLYLAGESWGAGRAASVAYALQARGRRVAGIVLISGGWSLNTEYVPAALRRALGVVDMAGAALFHGRSDPALGTELAAVQRAADRWARERYAPALERLDALDDAERDAIAAQLSRFTGLPADRIDRRRLEISPRQFRTQLLADRGQQAYVFDLRRTAPPGEAAREAILRYLRRDLGFHSDLPYVGLEPLEQAFSADGRYPESVGARWDYATADVTPEQRRAAMEAAMASGSGPPRLGAPLPATEEALKQNPALRVLVAGGLYDSFLPCAIGAETERRLPEALRRSITFTCYVGGHAMYEDAPTRAQLARDLRQFFRASGDAAVR